MSVTIVDTSTDQTGSGSINSRSMDLPSNASGDLMLLIVSWSNTGANPNTPSGWTLLDSFAGGNHANFVYYKESTGSEASVTISLVSGFLSYAAACVSYAGVDLTGGLTNFAEATSTGSGNWDWPALTADSSTSAIVRVGAGRQGAFPDPSGDTDFTLTVTVVNTAVPPRGVVGFYHDLDGGATGTIPSLSESNSSFTSYGLYTIELPASGGGGGTTVTLPDPVLSEATGFTLSVSYAPLTVTLPDPVLSESVGFALSVSYAALTVTLPDPTLSESLGFPLSVSYDPLVVTLPAPSLAESVGYPLSVSSGAISIILPDPVLSEATGFDLSVSYAPLTVTLTDPVLSEGVGFTIQVSYAQLNIVLPNPTLSEAIGFDLSVSYGSLAGLTTYMPMSQDPSIVMGMEIGRPFLA